MLVRLVPCLIATVVAAGLVPARTEAQGLYYRSIPIGERAIGLGSAYTGIADDPSATYYNPGGLMSGGRFQLLGSLSSIVFSRQKLENVFESSLGQRDLTCQRARFLTDRALRLGEPERFERCVLGGDLLIGERLDDVVAAPDDQFASAYEVLELAAE